MIYSSEKAKKSSKLIAPSPRPRLRILMIAMIFIGVIVICTGLSLDKTNSLSFTVVLTGYGIEFGFILLSFFFKAKNII